MNTAAPAQPKLTENLNCKSNQKRLATPWGYVKQEPARQPLPPSASCPLTEDGYNLFKLGWKEAEAAHGITRGQ